MIDKIAFIKTHADAILPTSNHSSDSGYDVYAVEDKTIYARSSSVVDVGLKFAHIPEGYWVRVEGRSGLSFKHSILPHPGIIDNLYRGNAGILLYNHSDNHYTVKKGDKIAQLVVYKLYKPELTFTDEVSETARGENGFGSSGR